MAPASGPSVFNAESSAKAERFLARFTKASLAVNDSDLPENVRAERDERVGVEETEQGFSAADGDFPAEPRVFDPAAELAVDSSVLFLGKRRTGKSFVARDWLAQLWERYGTIVVMTNTKFNGFWQEVMPRDFVHEGFDEDFLMFVMDEQRKRCEAASEQGATPEDLERTHAILIILDDVVSDVQVHASQALNQLYSQGRHFKIATWLLTQYVYAISPLVRGNRDITAILYQSHLKGKKAIHEEWLSQVRAGDAARILSTTTKDHNVLIVDNSVQSDELEETLAVYKADAEGPGKQGTRPFFVGSAEYREAGGVPVDAGPGYEQPVNHRARKMEKWPECLLDRPDSSAYLFTSSDAMKRFIAGR